MHMTESLMGTCRLCGHTRFKVLFNREFKVLLCRNCGLVFQEERGRDHRKYYSEEYDYGLDDGDRSEHMRLDDSIFKWVTKHLPGTENLVLLEIGCGAGFLLKRFRDYGIQAFGIEPSKRAVEFAKRVNGIEQIECCMLDDFEAVARLFDVVVLVQTFEHFADPLSSLLKIRGLLKEEGLLFIEVPNFFAPNGFYLFKVGGVSYPSPNHLFVYSRRTLRAFLRKAGLSVCRLSYTVQNIRMIATVGGDGENVGFENYHKVVMYYHMLPIITRIIDAARFAKHKLVGVLSQTE
jgi:SAM-dependent methyltransferase